MTDRRAIYVEGYGHQNPIPAASRLDNVVASGIITGRDGATGKLPSTLDEQCALMFRHLRSIIEAAGGTVDDIVKLNVWMADRSQREGLNREWLKMFPDADKRPARQTMQAELGGGMLVHCDFLAVVKPR